MEKLLMKKRGVKLKIIILTITIILVAIAAYFTFFYSYQCNSYECFQKAMKQCDRITYINEEPEASWEYNIVGERGEECIIEVKLLQTRKGELGIDKLNGLSMQCSYRLGISAYPDKDLSKCHGRLKEEIQSIIIKKLHTYILENLKEFDQNLNTII